VQAVQHAVYVPLDLPPMAVLEGRLQVVVCTHRMRKKELAEIAPALHALEGAGQRRADGSRPQRRKLPRAPTKTCPCQARSASSGNRPGSTHCAYPTDFVEASAC
jgi:hypothetical protein